MKPREKLLQFPVQSLTDDELWALIFTTGAYSEGKWMDVTALSRMVSTLYAPTPLKTVRTVRDMEKIFPLSFAKSCQVLACIEIGRRLYGRKKDSIHTPDDIAKRYQGSLPDREVVWGLYVNSMNVVIHEEIISIGTVNASLVHPREVCAPAIEYRAVGFFLVHNHPSQEPTPSEADFAVTDRVKSASEVLGLHFIDHVIVTDRETYSFHEAGLL